MKKPKPGTPSREASAGQNLVLAFMDLGVNDMRYTLDAMQRVYAKASALHDEMMGRELKLLTAAEAKAAGVKKTRAKPAPLYRSKKSKSLQWSGRGSVPRWMKEEMKALKLKRDAFLIVKR